MGFEGDDLQTKKRRKIVERAQAFTLKDINVESLSVYLVASKSHTGVSYTINIDAWSCDCPDYPLIEFCKHLYGGRQFLEKGSVATAGLGLEKVSVGRCSRAARSQLEPVERDLDDMFAKLQFEQWGVSESLSSVQNE
ncbi:hypothetical protein C8F01DRAFT_1084415 [Mycena amicta]|nr:hypothetical protein C8F01DRAFT_1084415 [Mycena amicta]